MQLSIPQYDPRIIKKSGLQGIQAQEIEKEIELYFAHDRDCYEHSSQQRYAEAFVQGLLSNLERKSIEPIALRLNVYYSEQEVKSKVDEVMGTLRAVIYG